MDMTWKLRPEGISSAKDWLRVIPGRGNCMCKAQRGGGREMEGRKR